MSFESVETSRDRGEPIQLYQFTYGPGELDKFCYTDAETNVPWGDLLFLSVPIERGDITSSGTTDKSSLVISLPQTEDIAELFRVYPPSFTVGIILWQGHADIPLSEYKVIFSGVVLSCAREGGLEAKLTCEPLSVSMQRVGLRRNYQYMCPHVLYGNQCRADKAAASTTSSVVSVTGRYVLLAGAVSEQHHYAGGLLEWLNGRAQMEYRTILSVDSVGGDTRLLLGGTPIDLDPGTAITMSKGCAHTTTACVEVHDNILNYGGQPYIPTKNPLGRFTPFL